MATTIAYPSYEECLNYFEEYCVPQNIRAHCFAVARLSHFIATELQKQGKDIDPKLSLSLGLCHDLFKAAALEELKPLPGHDVTYSEKELAMHAELRGKYAGKYEGEIFGLELGSKFPKFAKLLCSLSDPENNQKSLQQQIIHYSDFRMEQETIVQLSDRLNALENRYSDKSEEANIHWKISRKVAFGDEESIFQNLNFPPEELKARVKEANNSELK